jgi:vacuolar-type H+-ATPase subunit E/Vma4
MKSLVWLINGWSSVARIGQATRRDADRARREAKAIELQMAAEARRQIQAAAAEPQEPVTGRAQRVLQRRRERAAAQLEAS